MDRRALLVGVNYYDYIRPALSWCEDDALAMYVALRSNADGGANYACHVILGEPPKQILETAKTTPDAPPLDGMTTDVRHQRVTFNSLLAAIEELFDFDGQVIFYYAGHGVRINGVSYLATQDGTEKLPGVRMNEVLGLANKSHAREILLILDSCFSSATSELDGESGGGSAGGDDISVVYVRPGVTLLATAAPTQRAVETVGQGVFTKLVLGALNGGAADLRGRVSAASINAYLEQALGPWDQRPIYKSNASQLSPIRYCTPEITDEQLRRLPKFFPTPESQYPLDPTYEVTSPRAIPEHVAIFKLFKKYQVTHLLRPSFEQDLYFAATNNRSAELTPLGRLYWQLAKANQLGENQTENPVSWRQQMPDPESVARLFHETYERLAPTFSYETRRPSRIPWTEVPELNQRLMIAVAAEVLATLFSSETAPLPTIPDAESVARLFHETYERLAPTFSYEKREATRVRWEDVPLQNRLLMIAIAAEVLAALFPLPDLKREVRSTETNIFASTLNEILSRHGARLGLLDDRAGIHHEKVRRLLRSLKAPKSLPVLNPDELGKVAVAFSLSNDEVLELRAAVLTVGIQDMLMDRIGSYEAHQVAVRMYPIILDTLRSRWDVRDVNVLSDIR